MIKDYYRKITVSLPQSFSKRFKKFNKIVDSALSRDNLRQHGFNFLLLFLVLLSIFSLISAILLYYSYGELRKNYREAVNNLDYWEKVVMDYPAFPDGYYNAAIFAGTLDQKQKALEYLDKALKLDPDFEDAKELRKLIGNR